MAPLIYLPVGAPLVTNTKFGTDSMIGWMRQITQAIPSGGAAPADATYVLTSANGSLPNSRVATSTATITVDLSSAGLIKWNAVNTSPVVAGTEITLTNAQIKALPTTAIEVIPAPGANTRFAAFWIDLQSNFTAGAYTNVSADGFLSIEYTGHTGAISNYIANDSTVPLTFLDDFLSAQSLHVLLQPYTYAEPVNAWGNLALNEGFFTNTGLSITLNNGGAGNLTGGNAANTVRVTPYYIPVASA